MCRKAVATTQRAAAGLWPGCSGEGGADLRPRSPVRTALIQRWREKDLGYGRQQVHLLWL